MRHTLMSLWSSQGDSTGNSGWGSANCCRLWVHQNALGGESRLAPCRGGPTSCWAEARLLCSGACRVWGRGRSPSARPPSCPVLAPGIFPTFRFTWALSPAVSPLWRPALLGWHFRETGKGDSVSGSAASSWSAPDAWNGSLRGLAWFLTAEAWPSLGPPPCMQPRVRFASRLPLALLSGHPSWASRDQPRQGDPSRLQSVAADHGAHSYFTKSSAPSHPPPALSAADSSPPPLVFATGVQAALSYFSLLRLSLLSGM